MVVTDGNGMIRLMNKQAMRLFGHSHDELLGRPIETLIPKRFRHAHPHKRVGYLDKPEVRGMGAGLELRGLHKDGREIPVEISLSPLETDTGVMVLSAIRDITDRIKARDERAALESRMQSGRRMETVGRLAGGIAHDFNNILTVIMSYVGFMRDQFRQGDPLRDDLDVIWDASEQAERLTGQLLAFSRRQVQELRTLVLNKEVENISSMLQRVIGGDVQLVTKLEEGLGYVRADPSQIEQVLMNLAINARDAMPKGGKLTIETATVEIGEDYSAQKGAGVPPGSYVMLAVTDTGEGMDAETQGRIFEPFFSTKAKNKGTGLGLSTVFGIVKQSKGFVWVYSELEQGTTFKVYLPQVAAPIRAEELRPRQDVIVGGTETILLVEDEEMVRKAASRILRGHGYEVLEGAHGSDALLIVESHGDRIDLMLTDIIMPEMGGRVLADRIAKKWPKIRVVYMSGYTDNAVVHHGVLDEGVVFIQKPFTVRTLLAKVRATLDE